MKMYSDRDHPENITAYIPNGKNPNNAMKRTAHGWEPMPTAEVLGPMATAVCDMIDEQEVKAVYDDHLRYGMKVITPARKRAIAMEKDPNDYRPVLERNKTLIK